MLGQGFFIEVFAVTALAGFDNSTIQLIWRDITSGIADNATILYSLNANASDIGSLSYVTQLPFYQRLFQFEFRNIDDGHDTLQNAGILTALLVAVIIDIVAIVLFFRYRYVSIVCLTTTYFRQCRSRFETNDDKRAHLLSLVMPDHITRELVEHIRRQRGGRTVLQGNTLIARAHRRVALCFIDMCE